MKNKLSYIIISVQLLIVALSSCSDTWDAHYGSTSGTKSNLNLYEYIKSQPDLSLFGQMIDIAGYDTILDKSQTYTVWAPVNSSLSGVNLTDVDNVTNIVKNHITRFSYPTSDIDAKTIFMLDKKFLSFKRTDSGFTFGGQSLELDKSNVAAKNGILHCIDGYVPYLNNLWEYIGNTPGLDSLRSYLYSQSKYAFDAKASVEIGTNDHGQAVYDSVITFTNPVLDKIGALHIEDSTYTTILPNNAAWTKAYNQIKSNYVTLAKDGGAAAQRLQTQWAIVRNLVFRQQVADTTGLTSLISTTGSAFQNPGYLFKGAAKASLSNGIAYTTDSIRFKASESYQQKIQIEAENSSFGRSFLYANLYVRSSLGTSLSSAVSQNKYLVVEPTTVSNTTQNTVTFPIPNTLSGKYNIYCVFTPSSVANETDLRQYKARFYFSYLDATGKQITDGAITATNGINTTTGAIGGTFTTNAGQVTKMFVTQYKFSYCNIYDETAASSNITVKLRVENATKITETVKYDRSMRIDYIVLEPVQ